MVYPAGSGKQLCSAIIPSTEKGTKAPETPSMDGLQTNRCSIKELNIQGHRDAKESNT